MIMLVPISCSTMIDPVMFICYRAVLIRSCGSICYFFLRLPKNQEIKRFFHTSLGAKRSPKITARSEVIDGFFFGFIHPVHAAFILRNTSKEYIFLNPNLSLAVVKQKNLFFCVFFVK